MKLSYIMDWTITPRTPLKECVSSAHINVHHSLLEWGILTFIIPPLRGGEGGCFTQINLKEKYT
jgi:hypothetical protein